MKSIMVGRTHNAIIDDEDLELVKGYKWWISSDGYAVAYKYIDGKYAGTLRMHRLIMGTPQNRITDHINRNKLDNRKSNLRVCTQSLNMLNCNPRSTNRSGVVGVSWDNRRNRWRSGITINGKTSNRYFKDFKAAVKNRKEYELRYYHEAN